MHDCRLLIDTIIGAAPDLSPDEVADRGKTSVRRLQHALERLAAATATMSNALGQGRMYGALV